MADWPVPRRHGPVAGPGALSYMRVDVRGCHPDRESTSHLHDHTPNRRQAARRLQPRERSRCMRDSPSRDLNTQHQMASVKRLLEGTSPKPVGGCSQASLESRRSRQTH